MLHGLSEIQELERTLRLLGQAARVKVLGDVTFAEERFPLYSIALGSTDPEAPTLGLFGGVHGLERIGSKVVLTYLRMIANLLPWDIATQTLLQKTRLVFMPVINPGGMYLRRRSNPNGVDLMRNAPVEAEKVSKFFLPAGHRISPRLPWFRGHLGNPMEQEALALIEFVKAELFPSKSSIAIDVHSGYGTKDRIWFPYAKSVKPFPNLSEVYAIKKILDETNPNHIYQMEPQAKEYTTHGDLWDYLYEEQRRLKPGNVFIPLALELGSWNWVKKSPRQLFSVMGMFNPLLPHRRRRALRRHMPLFDLLFRLVTAPHLWSSLNENDKKQMHYQAIEFWYSEAA